MVAPMYTVQILQTTSPSNTRFVNESRPMCILHLTHTNLCSEGIHPRYSVACKIRMHTKDFHIHAFFFFFLLKHRSYSRIAVIRGSGSKRKNEHRFKEQEIYCFKNTEEPTKNVRWKLSKLKMLNKNHARLLWILFNGKLADTYFYRSRIIHNYLSFDQKYLEEKLVINVTFYNNLLWREPDRIIICISWPTLVYRLRVFTDPWN